MHEFKTYKPKNAGPVKTIVMVYARTGVKTTYETSWGEIMTMDGAHFRVEIDGEKPYGCAIQTFLDTHGEVEGGWQKNVEVQAYLCEAEHHLVTLCEGREEVGGMVPVGHYVTRNPDGSTYATGPVEFTRRYELA